QNRKGCALERSTAARRRDEERRGRPGAAEALRHLRATHHCVLRSRRRGAAQFPCSWLHERNGIRLARSTRLQSQSERVQYTARHTVSGGLRVPLAIAVICLGGAAGFLAAHLARVARTQGVVDSSPAPPPAALTQEQAGTNVSAQGSATPK